jgi:hypothetical protein
MVVTARGDWSRAEVLAGQARTALRQDGIEESDVTSLVCAVQARRQMSRQRARRLSALSVCGLC